MAAAILARALHAQKTGPRISAVQPDPIVGSIDWRELTIQGGGFDEDFAVRLHAEDVVDTVIEAEDRLTYVDAQTVRVRAVFGTAASTWTVQVLHPDSVSSNVHTFRVEAPPPKIDVVRPLRRTQDGTSFKVTVQGATMTPSSTVRWNGNDLPTTPIKSSPKPNAITIGLEATVPPGRVEGPGQNAITVHTPPPGGGTSSPTFFTVAAQPFYQTTWFYVGLVGLVIVGGLGLHRLRVKHVREKELEQKVQRRTAALRKEKERTEKQARRLKELDEARRRLFEDLSHELRTPLTMISTPLRTVLADGDETPPDERQELLTAALRNAKRLEDLVDQVLKLSCAETGRLSLDPSPGDLVAFACETTRSFEPMAERNDVQLRFRTDPEQVPSVFDSEKLRSVLGNLLENALKYTPGGGKVLLHVKHPSEQTAVLRVSDTGPGIPEDEIPDLFDRFCRGTEAHDHQADGSGLGLSLANKLAELHGGSIEVESELGMGSTFSVRLPVQAPEAEPVDRARDEDSVEARADASVTPDENGELEWGRARPETRRDAASNGAAPAESSPTLLVVEDNAETGTYLRGQLSDVYHVLEAQDGAEALDWVQAASPDLVLSDVMMPGMDGVELCRRVKSDDALCDVPVLLLTAKAGEDAEVEGLDAGADAYVEKPFSMETLRARIRSVLDRREALRGQYGQEVVMRPTDISVTPEQEAFYEEARAVVEAHIDESGFTVEQFASEMSVSRSTLRRRLKEATGQTPAEFVRHLRLKRAAQLLREDADLRVYQVADAVGYESPDHFSRLFRDQFDASPSKYPE
ncbi:hybrid sensor histidine kinase/response regulator transcription factor [Salinibacter altiplanensis]|uniref:hybrid sensor histidine kinase/response regulator transcription factor n=1 Tax=Salinibacter altiplanensis TaxID=1803181 RepID=UPI001F1A8F54|nr:ATP-binding protein [Salinibacter altiplanensis]